MKIKAFLVLLFIAQGLAACEDNRFHRIFPLSSFKLVIDTCMRSYSDVLLLQDKIANHEKINDLLDLLVGRLIHLESYVEQLIFAYNNDATVSYEELEYLMKLIEHLEITITETECQNFSEPLNEITNCLKMELKKTLTQLSSHNLTQGRSLLYRFLPSECRSLQFA